MRITSLGHAGMLIDAAAGIVCDPWFTPAYFGSWVPFPDDSRINPREPPRALPEGDADSDAACPEITAVAVTQRPTNLS
ncbi:MAG TPA: hypothetical protein VGX23_20680 [Actinocrinis sp.]|nr:hypothetical protein [Actinocrinis sp.]